MNLNKISIIGSIIIIILIISIPTTYKLIQQHNNDLYKVVEEKIIFKAKKCYYDEKCLNEKITLKELYKLNYLEKMSNPITKEYYNEDSYVLKDNTNFKFIVVE